MSLPRKGALWLVVLSLAVAGAALFSLTRKKESPPPSPPVEVLAEQRFQLNNGLAVDLVAGNCGDQAALVALFDVGVEHDPPGRSGMAFLVRELLSAPAEAGRPARTVEVGGYFTQVSLVVPPAGLERELGDLAERMKNPGVAQPALDRARERALAALKQRRGGDASLTAMAHAAESASASRAQGYFGGIAAEIEAVQLTDVAAYLGEYFQPENARLVIVGQLDAKILKARIEQLFGGLKAGVRSSLRAPPGSSVRGTLVMGDSPQAIALAVLAPLPKDPDYPGFLVAATRLLESPLGAQAQYEPLARPEMLFVLRSLKPGEPPEPTAEALREEVAKVVAGPLATRDVESAKARFPLLVGYSSADPATCKKDPLGLAVTRGRGVQLGLDPKALDEALDTLTQEQLDRALESFARARTSAVIAGGDIR